MNYKGQFLLPIALIDECRVVVGFRVLGTLVKSKAVPDPFFGLNNESILDIGDSGRDYYTFWFFTAFDCKLVSRSTCALAAFCSLLY